MRRAPDDICRMQILSSVFDLDPDPRPRQALFGDQGPEGKNYARQMFNKISTISFINVLTNLEKLTNSNKMLILIF